MTDATTRRSRDAPVKRLLRAVASQAAVLSAAVHLLWAWPLLGSGNDPRPYVFVLAALFTGVIAAATIKADEYRRLYALGAGTLGTFLVGYVAWYGGETLTALATDPLTAVGKLAELVGVVAFVALYRLAPPTQVVLERRREQGLENPLEVVDPEQVTDAEPDESERSGDGEPVEGPEKP